MNVEVLYGVYFFVLIISFIILYYIQEYYKFIGVRSFFIATIIGIISVFILLIWTDTSQMTNNELIGLSILLIIIFLLPVFAILQIIYMDEQPVPYYVKE